jgi:hypothetical protein
MSDEGKTAQDFLDADTQYCQGPKEWDRLMAMLSQIELTSPGEKRKEMLRIFAEEFSGTILCNWHWNEVQKKLAEVTKISPVLQ